MKELTAWYQKKISSYDKEEWETMVEQLLVRGIYRRRVVDFTAKLRPYLIDVDLVRGSSFPKAKPTLGACTVVWFALLRLLFLPGLLRWWRQQTSSWCARCLLALWLLQVANVLLYALSPSSADVDVYCLLVPLVLMIGLSVIHAQIVSTTALQMGRARPDRRRKWQKGYRRRPAAHVGESPGASAESGATSSHSKGGATVVTAKARLPLQPARHNEADAAEKELFLRKRRNILAEFVSSNQTENVKRRSSKAKDSDDEDYMQWKKKPLATPTVSFNAPLTVNLKHDKCRPECIKTTNDKSESLEKSNHEDVGDDNVQSIKNVDGDDGFESLSGNFSIDSEVVYEVRANLNARVANQDKVHSEETTMKDELEDVDNPLQSNICYVSKIKDNLNKESCDTLKNCSESSSTNLSEKISFKIDRKLSFKKMKSKNSNRRDIESKTCRNDARKSIRRDVEDHNKFGDWLGTEAECGADNKGEGKSSGVRFRNSWVQEMIENVVKEPAPPLRRKDKKKVVGSSSSEGECETGSVPSIGLPSQHTMSDWVGQTTNSEECSYSDDSEGSGSEIGFRNTSDSTWDPCAILNHASDTVNCTVWEQGKMLKAELSPVDISWYVVARAEHAMAAGSAYVWAGMLMAALIAVIAPLVRLIQVSMERDTRAAEEISSSVLLYLPALILHYSKGKPLSVVSAAFGDNIWVLSTNLISCMLRLALAGLVFFLLAVAERAFKQRFLYAKLFSHLTSARRARKSELPHFRLNTVRNIKAWLSARSYLRRRGPQRSVDVIVSAAFLITLLLLAYISAQLLRESITLECSGLLECMVWCVCLGVYLLRLMTLGSNINRKYRACLSALITEQINLHLAIEQRPEHKDQLNVANNVLKLAADLLKELDSPFKISGMCANHYLYTVTKVVIVSAMSGVLSEMLGFKLKLDKIKIK